MTDELKKRKNGRQIAVYFNEEMLSMLDRFLNEKGYDTISEVIKQSIRTSYAKEFPAYVDLKREAPKSLEEKVDYEDRKKALKDKKEEDRFIGICEQLDGKIETNEGGNKVCKYFTYDRKNRYDQELPLSFLSEDLIASQYSPSKEDVEKRQVEGKVNYEL